MEGCGEREGYEYVVDSLLQIRDENLKRLGCFNDHQIMTFSVFSFAQGGKLARNPVGYFFSRKATDFSDVFKIRGEFLAEDEVELFLKVPMPSLPEGPHPLAN